MSGFIRHLIPYYSQLVEPLQQRKVNLLAEGREAGKVVIGNPGKRKSYCQKTKYEPTPQETLAFESVQAKICKEHPTVLLHHDPAKQLFLQIDRSLERGFGVMVFHLKN